MKDLWKILLFWFLFDSADDVEPADALEEAVIALDLDCESFDHFDF